MRRGLGRRRIRRSWDAVFPGEFQEGEAHGMAGFGEGFESFDDDGLEDGDGALAENCCGFCDVLDRSRRVGYEVITIHKRLEFSLQVWNFRGLWLGFSTIRW